MATMEVKRTVEGKLPALVGVDTTYTYGYVRDAAEAIARALTKRDTIGRGCLIGNQCASTRDYFNTIGRIADVPVPSLNIPDSWLLPLATGLESVARRTGRRPLLPLETALAESIAEIRSAA